MPTTRLVLVAIDFSDVTEAVLDAARGQAGTGVAYLALHVAPEDPDYVPLRLGPEEERDAIAQTLRSLRERLHDVAERLAGTGSPAEPLVVQGSAADRIVEEAHRRGAVLIVLGRHRHGRLHDTLVGSVAERVIRRATCPVLVVPAGPPGEVSATTS